VDVEGLIESNHKLSAANGTLKSSLAAANAKLLTVSERSDSLDAELQKIKVQGPILSPHTNVVRTRYSILNIEAY